MYDTFLPICPQLTAHALHQFHLGPYGDVLVKDLSGGNRRKLSVAVTCFGDTAVVLMDEPTSDMDPVTRHLTYACIREVLSADRAVILTSHTVAEIDRVCDRIAILRRGRLVSMGDTHALQSTYGLCYAVRVFRSGRTATMDGSDTTDRQLAKELHERLPGMESATVTPDDGGGGVQFVVRIRSDGAEDGDEATTAATLRLSDVCELMHRFAVQHNVMYTMAQCLLDQVSKFYQVNLYSLLI